MSKAAKKEMKAADSHSKASSQRHKRKQTDQLTDANLEAIAEDCDREMYGDDYEALKWSGWLDR